MTTVALTNNELNGHHDHGDQSQPRMETEHVRDWRRCQVVGLLHQTLFLLRQNQASNHLIDEETLTICKKYIQKLLCNIY